MKFINRILLSLLLCVLSSAHAAGTLYVTGNVNAVRVQHWNPDNACIKIGNDWFKLDLSTVTGKSSYSLALTSFAANVKLTARWMENSTLVGGCDTGKTVHPLYSIEATK
jgi:hypothetical protein